ncbi:hypothetical protein NCS52_00997900 [Fusarium sp. LHS14.1]|nr:hypothetical protein NCS52_00997900 [Fusarium sp. LHS14.1]
MTQPLSTIMENMSMPPESDETIRGLILLFENMDGHLIGTAREALQHRAESSSSDHRPLPTSEMDLRLLEVAFESYRESNFSMDRMVNHLSTLPDYETLWSNVSRTILRHFQGTVRDRQGEWKVWLSQIQRVGEETWQKAVNASNPLCLYTGEPAAAINAIIRKLGLVDDLLDEIHSNLYVGTDLKREHFSSELQDTLLAAIDMAKQGADLTVENIGRFKAAIRANRAAKRVGYAVSTSVDADTDMGGPEATLSFRGSSTGNPATTNTRTQADGGTTDGNSGSLFPSANMSPAHKDKYNPTTLAVIVIITIAAAGLTAKGWVLSPHEIGKSEDSDFWFLLQSSLMQVASMVPIVFSLLDADSPSLQSRLWSWIFLVSGMIFSFLAPLLYLVVLTEYSAVIAFCGSVAQVLIVLEAMFLVRGASTDGSTRSNDNKDR